MVVELARARDVGRVEERPEARDRGAGLGLLEPRERVEDLVAAAKDLAVRAAGGRAGAVLLRGRVGRGRDARVGRDERGGELLERDGARVVGVDRLEELAQPRDLRGREVERDDLRERRGEEGGGREGG